MVVQALLSSRLAVANIGMSSLLKTGNLVLHCCFLHRNDQFGLVPVSFMVSSLQLGHIGGLCGIDTSSILHLPPRCDFGFTPR